MQLQSFVQGAWHASQQDGVALRDATTGEVIARASSAGIDFPAVLDYARAVGGPALRELTFHERAACLKSLARKLLERKETLYALSVRTGATRSDSWIDIEGGIGTLFSYASKGVRELPNGHALPDGAAEGLSKGGTFIGQHLCVPLVGAAVHINAFNFPCWGLLEKFAPAFLAGVPVITKPATTTAYLAELLVRQMLESDELPAGALQLVCGSLGNLFEHLTGQDVVGFTGSAATAAALKAHPRVIGQATRFVAETDSLNSSILGPDARPGAPEFDLFIREVVREMTVKAGQKCTAIRRALVPAGQASAVLDAIKAQLAAVVVGDPRSSEVTMGPLVSLSQRAEVLGQVRRLEAEAELVTQAPFVPRAADPDRGAFLPPTLLYCREPAGARAVHTLEAFGPVCTVLPFEGTDGAISLARLGDGSLAASVFTADDRIARQLALGLAPHHGRLLFVNRHCAKESTGHGSPLPQLVHGGPGRAGGGEELGGIRGLSHYLQRTALQGAPNTLSAIVGRFMPGSTPHISSVHPFRKPFHELAIGDSFLSPFRTVTVEDIERFADVSGDRFYAHMDEAQASRNPFFGGRVAHGYFLVSAAAGLFVDPAFGPVLANYGLDNLRFLKPVKPGDQIRVRLSCKDKSLRAGAGYGEVRWDTEITNQRGERVASYDVLTMVSEEAEPVPGASPAPSPA
jgi:oxepin-CoA hydrolase/3-oxo-5,6-dehydrosuberyl-CoA semialdehyde dehydrogenase